MRTQKQRLEGITSSATLVQFSVILIAVALNLIYPGEVFSQCRFLLFFFALLCCARSLVFPKATLLAADLPMLAVQSFLPLLLILPSVMRSVSSFRSQETFLLFLSYSCLYLSIRVLRPRNSLTLVAILVIVAISIYINLLALYQSAYEFKFLYNQIIQMDGIKDDFRSALLTRLATGRVYAHFALPNTLAGFLAMVLPLNLGLLILAYSGRRSSVGNRTLEEIFQSTIARWILSSNLLMSFAVLLMTQSFGGWIAAGCSLAGGAIFFLRRSLVSTKMRLIVALTSGLGGAIALALISRQRGFTLWNFQAHENPIALRWITFATAWKMFRDFPATGVGLGNFGVMNPRYQSSPTLVTQFAHNTALQLLAETGLLLVPLIVGACFAVRHIARKGSAPTNDIFSVLKMTLATALCAWLIHNCLDIDFYFPSLGALGVFLLALLANLLNKGSSSHFHWCPSLSFMRSVSFGLIFLSLLLGTGIYVSQVLATSAASEANQAQFPSALRHLGWALKINPKDPTLVILDSKINFQAATYRKESGFDSLPILRSGLERAVALDPYNANYHYELSRVYAAFGAHELSQKALLRANFLFPSEPKFQPHQSNKFN